MGVGGKRKGAGRKPGSVALVSREVANRIMGDGGVMPLEVVITGMRELFKAAQRNVDPEGNIEWDYDKLKEAVVAADRALPFCHARINPIDMPKDPAAVDPVESNPLEDARRVAFLLTHGKHLLNKEKK